MGPKPTSSMEIYFPMGVKEAFSFLIILFHSSKLCVVYVYVISLMVCLLQILNKTLTIIKGYFLTLKEESYLKDMLRFLFQDGSCSTGNVGKER